MGLIDLSFEDQGTLAIVTITRPEVNNCFDNATVHDLAQAFNTLSKDEAVRACIFTGAGKAFSAGVDLSAPPDAVAQASDDAASLVSTCPLTRGTH